MKYLPCLLLMIVACTVHALAHDDRAILEGAKKLYSSYRPSKGRASIFIPVYSTGCSKCVSMELELQRAVRRCSQMTIDTIVNYVSVDRHSQYSSLKYAGQIPAGAVPDIGHRFERLIGSRPSLAVVVIVVDQRIRFASMNAEDICRQLQSLSKEP